MSREEIGRRQPVDDFLTPFHDFIALYRCLRVNVPFEALQSRRAYNPEGLVDFAQHF
jgi:hypothetical protein